MPEVQEHPPLVYDEADFDGHNAAPLLLFGSERDKTIVKRQDKIVSSILGLARSEIGRYASQRVVDWALPAMRSRIHQREGLNSRSYMNRTYKDRPAYNLLPELFKSDIDIACERAKYGEAVAKQNEIARVALGMKTAEYGNLTILGQKRKNLESHLWDDISELTGVDATPDPSKIYRIKLLGLDRDITQPENVNYGAMRIEIKRHVGKTAYGAVVKGRTTAIINTSTNTGFDSNLKNLFRETAIDAMRRKEGAEAFPEDAEGLRAIANLPEFQKCIHWLMTSEVPEGIVLARNETVYGAS